MKVKMEMNIPQFEGDDAKSAALVFPGCKGYDWNADEFFRSAAPQWLKKDWKEANWDKGKTTLYHDPLSGLRVILAGLGEEADDAVLRKAVEDAMKQLNGSKVKTVAILPGWNREKPDRQRVISIIAETASLSMYRFDRYKEKPENPSLERILVAGNEDEALQRGLMLAESTALARDLVNEPANTMTPEQLAVSAREAGGKYGFEVSIYDEKQIQEMGMKAYWSVAMGSDTPPRLIVMRWKGNPDQPEEILGLVGKGLTYDSGGYAIKPATGMVTMKSDMGGSAAVIGAMSAIAAAKLKANVTGVVAACENMISGHAYRNGDIIGSMAGKFIEVDNTDAEGRLTLIDGVHYAIDREKATRVVDIATLTGACVIALGSERIGVVSNNDEMVEHLEKASGVSGEKFWRLPHDDGYREQLKSEIADLRNTGGRKAGTITAGLFIREFVQDKPWLHLDIAGTSFEEKTGATGSGARLLFCLAEQLAR